VPFFEPLEPPKPRERRRQLRRDEYGRPTLTLPSYLAEPALIAESEEAAVIVQGIACYPDGFAFRLEAIKRYAPPEDDPPEEEPFGLWARPPENLARFGIGYSDGRRATLDRARFGHLGDDSADIAIVQQGGSGGAGHFFSDFWVQPLPPAGPVTFAVEWEAAGIPETLHTIEGQLFRDAAGRARPVFPDA
jgi:hypothetical protein